MIHSTFQLTGTHGAGWQHDARELLTGSVLPVRMAGADDAIIERVDERLRVLAIIQDPIVALAEHLVAEPAADIAGWIASWMQQGQWLMRLLQRQHGQCLFVRLDDALGHREAFAAALKARLGIEITSHADASAPRLLDSVPHAFAQAALLRHVPMSALVAELDAACLPLGGDALPSAVATSQGPLKALERAWTGYAQVAQQLQQVLKREEDLRVEYTSSRERLERDLAHAREGQKRAQVERDADRGALKTLTASEESARRRLATTEDENRQLLLHLHEVQELLEDEIGAKRSQDARVEALDGALRLNGAADLVIEGMQFAAQRDEGPYSQLDIRLLQVRCGGEGPCEHDIRLVEHRGHPGLVVFSMPGVAPLLGAWHETGREGDRPFMLVVPDDDAGAALLDRLPRTDHGRLVRVLSNVERELEDTPERCQWLALTRRLRTLILERDDRFRYDDLKISPVDNEPSMLEVEFRGVEFGVRQWAQLRVRWQPGGANPVALRLSDVPGDMPPLKGWVGRPDDSAPEPSWGVPLADVVGGGNTLAAWRSLDAADRRLLVALLDAMPAAASQAIDLGLVAESENARLMQESHELLRRVPVEPAAHHGRLTRLRALLKAPRRAERPAATAGATR